MTKKQAVARNPASEESLKGLADLIEKLGDLAEKGEELKKGGGIHHQDVKGVYGFSVKVGSGG